MLYGLHGVLTRMLTKSVPYTFNRGGYYYFSRRVSSDFIGHVWKSSLAQTGSAVNKDSHKDVEVYW